MARINMPKRKTGARFARKSRLIKKGALPSKAMRGGLMR